MSRKLQIIAVCLITVFSFVLSSCGAGEKNEPERYLLTVIGTVYESLEPFLEEPGTTNSYLDNDEIQKAAQNASSGQMVRTAEEISKLAWALAPLIPDNLEGYPEKTEWAPTIAIGIDSRAWMIGYKTTQDYQQAVDEFRTASVGRYDGDSITIIVAARDGHVITMYGDNGDIFPTIISNEPDKTKYTLPSVHYYFFPFLYNEYKMSEMEYGEITLSEELKKTLPVVSDDSESMAKYAEAAISAIRSEYHFSAVGIACLTRFIDGTWEILYHVKDGSIIVNYRMIVNTD